MADLRLLESKDADAYVEHMRIHSAESGQHGDPVFMPWGTRHPLNLGSFKKRRVRIWGIPLNAPGWGRTWGLYEGERIIGHVEMSGGIIPADMHRTTLGMGLERPWRGAGHGRTLLEFAIGWAREQPDLVWLDLGVFGKNERAQKLYRRAGFAEIGRCADRFRVDGELVDDISMTLHLPSAVVGGTPE